MSITPVPKPSQKRRRPPKTPPRIDTPAELISSGDYGLSRLALDRIDHGNNPRLVLDPERHAALAESIRQHGVLQPIRVRPVGEERYQIVAGHRRYEAARTAGLETIPVVVTTSQSDDDVFVESLVENLQREDLDPIDEATAYRAILDRTGWTQVQLGEKVGRSQPQISQSLAFLTLRPEVQKELSKGTISSGHAKVLAYMSPERQAEVTKQVLESRLTVRQVEDIAQRDKAEAEHAKRQADQAKSDRKALLALLEEGDIAKDRVIAVPDEAAAKMLREKGWVNARKTNWHTDSTTFEWECDCDGLAFASAAWNSPKPTLKRLCFNKAHEKSARDIEAAAAKRKAKEGEVTVDRARRNTISALRARDVETPTDQGLRLILYCMYEREDLYGGGNYQKRREDFLHEHKAPPLSQPSDFREPIWKIISEMDPRDVVDEILDLAVATVLPNVFAQHEWANRKHAHVRQWMVDNVILPGQQRLPADIVWGGTKKEESVPDTYPELEADEAVEVAAAAAVEGEPTGADYRTALRTEHVETLGDHFGNAAMRADCPDCQSPEVADIEVEGIGTVPSVAIEELAPEPDVVVNPVTGWAQEAPAPQTMADALAEVGLADSTAQAAPATEIATMLPSATPVEETAKLPLAGEMVVVTGVVEGLTRDEVTAAVVRAGGMAADTVTNRTTLLVVGEKPGGKKVSKAKDLGIRSITEAEFRALVR